ncbi:UNVERIFIED_CONTAM: hypothetical protein FKN15_027210 [Acipenser sinensis]
MARSGGDDLRLVNGSSPCAGRVEILHEGQWGTVSCTEWELEDAAVVCKQLGCGSAVSAPGNAHFGAGSGPIWLAGVACSSSHSALRDCRSWGWGVVYGRTHAFDAGVICSSEGVRLSGGSDLCSGRVEVLRGSAWNTVCDAGFDRQDAEVVCRQLQCGIPQEVLGAARFGKGQGPVWSQEIQCSGNEPGLHGCPTSSMEQPSCTHANDVGLVCVECWAWGAGRVPGRTQGSHGSKRALLDPGPSSTELRLAGSSSPCSGRVEVWFEGSWGTVCDDSWNLKDAQVVCRQLGCGAAESTGWGEATFEQGNGTIWLDEVNCRGSEMHLWDCRHSPLRHNDCDHKEDAWVTCAEASPSRLQPQRDMTIPVIACIVLGALLFVVLVLLAGQLHHNRMLRRGIAKDVLDPFHEAVYEEIEYKLARQETYGAPRRGSFLSDELPSDYDDVEDSEGNPIPGESMPSLEGETPGYYDDAVPVNSNPEDLSGEFLQTSPVEEPCTNPSLGERSFHSDKLPSGYYDVEDSEGNPIQGFPLTPPGEESARAALPLKKDPLHLTGLTTMMLGRSLQERVERCEAGSVSGGE